MWTSQNSTGLSTDGWIRGVHKDSHIDYCWAEKFKKGAVWSTYTVGQSLASCCPERCIQIECEFLPCFCVYVTAHTVSFQNIPALQLSLLSELRTPLWLANQLYVLYVHNGHDGFLHISKCLNSVKIRMSQGPPPRKWNKERKWLLPCPDNS